ncbi:thymidylate synthase [Xanthomonas hortorum]|nr:thymidylate synthase [Xanthomonas hortorum]
MDDALHKALGKIIKSKKAISLDSTKGSNRELVGVQIRISDPRARFSRAISRSQLFSSLGELFWYWGGSNRLDQISYYVKNYRQESEDGLTVPSAYGPRLFALRGKNQIDGIVNLLREKPTTRRAVIQLYDAEDLDSALSPPCTCTLQFLMRQGKLNLFVSMRSNDILFGFPHDVFAFTMIQEIISRRTGVELGEYIHSVGSLHLYANQQSKAQNYLAEGYQEKVPMPAMPEEDPSAAMLVLVRYEREVRLNQTLPAFPCGLADYWLDLARLLAIYKCYKKKDRETIEKLKNKMSASVYEQAISKRAGQIKWQTIRQEPLNFTSQD